MSPPSTHTHQSAAEMLPVDYIVVGGGTAGLTVASRLSEDEHVQVLVVEAGPAHDDDPLAALQGRSINQARGRGLGGSSSMNFMMWLHPSRASMDAWEKLGNPGWGYDGLAPYFKKSCTVHPPSASAKQIAGLGSPHDFSEPGNGPVHVSFSEGYSMPLNNAWMETFSSLGYAVTADPRTGKAVGAFQNPASIDPATKARSYAANAPNLTVLTDATVKRIIFEDAPDGPVAKGVVAQTKDGETTLSVRSEVILAAGALQSPQLLELSGIGGRQVLERCGISVLVDNPNVGERLQDHAIVCQSFEVGEGVPSGDVLRDSDLLNTLVQLYSSSQGAGPLGQSNISTAYIPLVDQHGIMSAENRKALFDTHLRGADGSSMLSEEFRVLRSVVEPQDEPTAQYLLFPSQISIPREPENMASYITPVQPQNFITIMTVLNHPFSRGSVHVTSSDVNVKPVLDPRYMTHPLDLEITARHVQFVEQIVKTEPFRSSLKEQGARLPETIGNDLEKAKDIVRRRQISVFHVCGTCAMLPRGRGGVVDSRLQVYGTKNVRVVDASIFPLQTLGNTQSVVYAVAERAADLIKQDRAARVCT
ncbi:glucose-methanol-choline oxidoreductase [Apiospora phragmitis]|uniref:Glucose-methanol-choline oxidoreductase n=1 Tax=Apiospora phragmitis TaxID=2905665 RepID=A0ABR1SVN3_9PEZI